jgi:hypothetical protein
MPLTPSVPIKTKLISPADLNASAVDFFHVFFLLAPFIRRFGCRYAAAAPETPRPASFSPDGKVHHETPFDHTAQTVQNSSAQLTSFATHLKIRF